MAGMTFKRAKNIVDAFSKVGAKAKAASVFKQARFAAKNATREVFRNTSEKDWTIRAARSLGAGVGWTTEKIGMTAHRAAGVMGGVYNKTKRHMLGARPPRVPPPPTPKKPPSWMQKTMMGAAKTAGYGSLLTVGAAGMLTVGVMNGINNASKDIVLERYLADQRFARDMLLQSRVGLSMGTNQMNRFGSTMGLSNSLSRTRHGARY